MKLLYKILLSLLVIVIVSEVGHSQSTSRIKNSMLYAGYNSFGIVKLTAGAGTSWYYGDLCDNCIDPKANLNLGAHLRFNERISVKAELNWYQIGAKQDQYAPRNLSFKSNNIEFLAAGVVDLFQHSTNYYSRKRFTPFAYAGLGFTYFNPKAELDGTTYSLRPLQTEGVAYSPITVIVPGGIGVRVKVAHFLDISVEGGYRLTFTDYLDDVSTVYIAANDPLASSLSDRSPEIEKKANKPGGQRGNPDSRDGYFVAGVKAEITLPSLRSGTGGKRDSGVHMSKLTKKNRKRMLKNRR